MLQRNDDVCAAPLGEARLGRPCPALSEVNEGVERAFHPLTQGRIAKPPPMRHRLR